MRGGTGRHLGDATQSGLGALALVSLDKLRVDPGVRGGAHKILFGSETALWQRLSADRRRLEFLGGRLAAKLAVNRLRLSMGEPALRGIDVIRSKDGRPVVRSTDGFTPGVSISHTHKWAVALAVPGHLRCGIDIEDAASRVRLSCDYFHGAEIEIASSIGPKRHWVLKEAVAKLEGRGFDWNPHSVIFVPPGSCPDLARSARQSAARAFSGTCRSLAIGIALGRGYGNR
jgi:holo-[acyl-carrier protein] synthase